MVTNGFRKPFSLQYLFHSLSSLYWSRVVQCIIIKQVSRVKPAVNGTYIDRKYTVCVCVCVSV